MRIIADLHVHSKYARATSPRCDITGLSEGAKIKGINVMATGDFTHPSYFNEIRAHLTEDAGGLFPYGGIRFILSSEVALFYRTSKHSLRLHNVVLAPGLEEAEQLNDRLKSFGSLVADGRPMLKLSSAALIEECEQISKDFFIFPAHAWTPYFGIFGSETGVDSVEDAFEDKADRVFALESGLSCYDTETEVLTEDGWKPLSEVHIRDKICTINQKTEEIEYQKLINIYKYQYSGKMYRLKTKKTDLLVTPNHNLYYRPCDFRTRKPYRLAEAQFLFGKSKIFKKDGIWRGKNIRWFTLPPVMIRHGSRYYSGFRKKGSKKFQVEQWLKFFGFWIAEGWVTKWRGNYTVVVCNTDQKLLDEMENILKSFGYSVYRDERIVRVRDFQLFTYLKKFSNSSSKHVPLEVKKLSKDLLGIFFTYYIKGDGHIYGRSGKGLSATTISKKLRDDLQEISLKLGMSAYYKLHRKKGTPFSSSSKGKPYLQSNDSWTIYFIRKNQTIIVPSIMKTPGHLETWVDYSGYVYCVEVPNHVVYIRRNGIPLWCGNSDPVMNWTLSKLDRYSIISNSDAHSLEKLGREANVFDLEEVTYKSLVDAIKTKKGFTKTYEFYPEEGKYHYDGHRACNVHCSPEESKNLKDVCPVCRKKMTLGVMHRVAELADRKLGFKPAGAVPFQYVVPLTTVISKAIKKPETSAQVAEEYSKLIRYFGNEFAVYEATEDQLRLATIKEIADALVRVNTGKVRWVAGYDGVFGQLILEDNSSSGKKGAVDRRQKSLSDFE